LPVMVIIVMNPTVVIRENPVSLEITVDFRVR
jgi:hypothetical protein